MIRQIQIDSQPGSMNGRRGQCATRITPRAENQESGTRRPEGKGRPRITRDTNLKLYPGAHPAPANRNLPTFPARTG